MSGEPAASPPAAPAAPAPVVRWNLPSVGYLALAVVGAVGTWSFNLQYRPTPDAPSYLAGWFANPASSSAAVDLSVVAVAACIFFVREGRRLGPRRRPLVVALVVLTFVVALAFTFPLFLALRERALLRDRTPG